MELKDARAAADTFSGKASDVSRQLAFAGIAVIWILRVGDKTGGIQYAGALLLPLLMFVASLALDLLHYVYGAVAWLSFHRIKELELKDAPAETKTKAPRWIHRINGPSSNTSPTGPKFKAPRCINWPTNFFFYGKLVLNILAYLQLLSFIWKQL